MARQLSNPVASLISIPLQSNLTQGYGSLGAWRNTLNIQPVIPIRLNDDWNLISRTILPIIWRPRTHVGDPSTTGLGDVTASLFLSPSRPINGLTLGVGPVFVLPTATDPLLGAGKWGVGLTGLVLHQTKTMTIGMMANHIWSLAGPANREEVSNTLLQPFIAFPLGEGRTLSVNTESNYDWVHRQWTVPINVQLSQVMKLGGQMLSVAAGPQIYVVKPTGGPSWGLRFSLTFLFPEK
ncbi:hypothetical protein [Phreatobacter stygius]|uniref:hypothetical protein n=1 Tax=Phreatobacter stygius TaxID=1940610 RepID=UPI001FE7A990|nr:hypothetical protein [Phreatobacter stygius]